MSTRSRRQFLEQSMFAAAAAAAAAAAPVTASAQQGRGRAGGAGRGSANDTIHIAVLGTGSRGQAHLNAFGGNQATNTLVTHVCDADEAHGQQSAQAVAKRQNGVVPKVVRDMRHVFDEKSVHAVSIATPNHWHSLASIWAMQAGKDVYVEKPISHNVSEGRRVVETATKLDRICQTGTGGRSSVATADAIAFIRAGGIGEVLVSRGLCYNRRQAIGPKGVYEVPKTVDYDLWCGPAPMLPVTRQRFHYDWHWQFPFGNGDIGNQGPHQMDIARWALGVNRVSDAVIAYGGRVGYEDAGETPNTIVAIYPYGRQSLVFEVRGLETAPYRGATVGNLIEGTAGYVLIGRGASTSAFDQNGKLIRTFSSGGGDDHFANFIAAMRSRNRSILKADCVEGHLSAALCHLGNISYLVGQQASPEGLLERLRALKVSDNVQETFDRTREHLTQNQVDIAKTRLTVGSWLTVDPVTERFTGGTNYERANTMLTRDYRAPYVVPASAARI
jgi:predicted dehydrogenase